MSLKLFLVTLLLLSSSPCEEISMWKYLLDYKISNNLNDRIKLLKERGFDMQELTDKGGKIINLDYFPVIIKVLPKNIETGKQFTAEEFLNHIRLNSNHFVNKELGMFSSSPLLGEENKKLWRSNNPIGAVMHINIPFPVGDGSVICTELTSNYWVYATIRAPWRVFGQGNDGKHPVTGIRQMGFIKNDDGTYTFYTKGVDRISRKFQAWVAQNFMKNPFKDADKLWESFRQGIYNFVIDNGGEAVSLDSTKVVTYRPKWNDIKDCSVLKN